VSHRKVRRSIRTVVNVVEESVGYEGRVGSNAFRESSEGLSKSFIGTEVGDEFRMKPRKKWGSRKNKREKTYSIGRSKDGTVTTLEEREKSSSIGSRETGQSGQAERRFKTIPTSSVKVLSQL